MKRGGRHTKSHGQEVFIILYLSRSDCQPVELCSPKYTPSSKLAFPETHPLHIGLLRSLLDHLAGGLLPGNGNRRLAVTSSLGIIVRGSWNFARELLEGLPLGLRNEESGEAATQHEESKDFHDVVEPWVWVVLGWVAVGSEGAKHSLSHDGTDLA
jgi:hypothetical protein